MVAIEQGDMVDVELAAVGYQVGDETEFVEGKDFEARLTFQDVFGRTVEMPFTLRPRQSPTPRTRRMRSRGVL